MFSTKQLYLDNQLNLLDRKPFICDVSFNYFPPTETTTLFLPFNSTQSSIVDWGDGSSLETIPVNNIGQHIYASSGTYRVKIYMFDYTSTANAWFVGTTYTNPINPSFTIIEFGDAVVFTNIKSAISSSQSLDFNTNSYPNTSLCTNFTEAFMLADYLGSNFTVFPYSEIEFWNTSNAINFTRIFDRSVFQENINAWNVSKVENFTEAFDSSTFNQPLNNWNTQSATNFTAMFRLSSFNQSLSNWITNKVTNMSLMFRSASTFNQNISNWDVEKVTNFQEMFRSSGFNQNLGSWNLNKSGAAIEMSQIFRDSSMSAENYSRTLIGWANYVYSNGQPKVVNMPSQINMQYNNTNYGGTPYNNAVDARNYLIAQGWNITGDSQV